MKWLWGVLALGFLAACQDPQAGPRPAAPVEAPVLAPVVLHDGATRVALQVELAMDEPARARGLMFRDHLAEGMGMLFVWPNAEERRFWMKNTRIPLDMIFLRGGRVLGVIPWAKPFDETPVGVDAPADMVLEVPGGWAQAHSVGAGWQLDGAEMLPGRAMRD